MLQEPLCFCAHIAFDNTGGTRTLGNMSVPPSCSFDEANIQLLKFSK